MSHMLYFTDRWPAHCKHLSNYNDTETGRFFMSLFQTETRFKKKLNPLATAVASIKLMPFWGLGKVNFNTDLNYLMGAFNWMLS